MTITSVKPWRRFAWAQSRVSSILPGNQMVFFILATVVVVDIILTYEPFLPLSVDKPKHEGDEEFVADVK